MSTTATKTDAPATDRQRALFDRLVEERVHPYTPEVIALLRKASGPNMSKAISALLGAPRKPKPVETVTIEPGVYKKNGDIYEIKKSRTGVLRVKRIRVVGSKVQRYASFYRAGQFTPDDKVTLDDATGFGHQYGICCCCFRLLTDAQSVHDGIGPVCKKRYFPAQ
ncbi:hypothetical protein HII36_05200 [Nonomuraea sp. NN258]|uniref:DUF6011 domain-containing protein n=1 Tax=Nonomuraea antri TaxID=2730852 RepID=UPI0015695B98|nr:DUF6011 domain-containing protein [Nonomuraea antri]NRQ31233.1 hypothetical protein [Nonomuraea antri]